MYEQSSTAFVLGKENVSEYDYLVSLYSKDLGKILARVTSGAKMSSRLMPHLQVGNKVAVRIVERRIMRVADALSFPLNGRKNTQKRLMCLSLLSFLSADTGADEAIWIFLEKGEWSTAELLKILGLYTSGGECFACKKDEADYFSGSDSGFYCAKCSAGGKGSLMYKLC